MRRIALIISALFGHQGQRATHQSRLAALAVVGTWVGATLLILAYLSLGLWSAHDPNLLALQATISFVISLIAAYICGALAAWQGANGGPRWWIDNGMARPGGTPLDDRVYQANRDPFPPLYNARITTQTATIVIAATIMGTTPAMIWPLHLLGLMAAMVYGFSRYASAYHGRVMRPATSIAGIFGVFAFLLEWAMFLFAVMFPKASDAAAIKGVQLDGDLARFILDPEFTSTLLLLVLAIGFVVFLLWKKPKLEGGLAKLVKWGIAAWVIVTLASMLLGGLSNAAANAVTSTRSTVSQSGPVYGVSLKNGAVKIKTDRFGWARIQVTPGTYEIHAEGKYKWDPQVGTTVGPAGESWTPTTISAPEQFPAPDAPIVGLLARVGSSITYIGEVGTVTTDGTIDLGLNERWNAAAFEDNPGCITVTLKKL